MSFKVGHNYRTGKVLHSALLTENERRGSLSKECGSV